MRAETRVRRAVARGDLRTVNKHCAALGAAAARNRSRRDGKSLEQVVAAKPTAEFDATWGSRDHMLFLPAIYAELARRN